MSTSHRPGRGLAESRYVLPSFVERTSYGIKEMNPYNKLFEERIIFLGVQIDDASANDVMAQLITLESIDPDRDILIYINSPGGSVTSMMAIYDTMQYVQPEVQTICIGQAASARGGAAGRRAPRASGWPCRTPASCCTSPPPRAATGSPATWRSRPRRSSGCGAPWRRSWPSTPAGPRSRSGSDIERDKFFTAEEAKEYGLVDEVLTSLKRKAEVGSS